MVEGWQLRGYEWDFLEQCCLSPSRSNTFPSYNASLWDSCYTSCATCIIYLKYASRQGPVFLFFLFFFTYTVHWGLWVFLDHWALSKMVDCQCKIFHDELLPGTTVTWVRVTNAPLCSAEANALWRWGLWQNLSISLKVLFFRAADVHFGHCVVISPNPPAYSI